ncbi:MAG: hypothetical protein IKS31_00190 [Clostridia bacterium]|nr:hypothetical protein [Clostridia bacterium]
MKETMTVHKALCELKLLDARINKEISGAKFVMANKHNNQKIGGKNIADYCASVKEKYQSIRTLINRRNAIKRAVIMSNALTKVVIAGKEYTVAQAIDMKSSGNNYLNALRQTLEEQLAGAVKMTEKENGSKLEERADTYLTSMYSGSDLKNMSDEIKKVRDAFIASQAIDIVDPIDASQEVEKLKDQTDAFMADVDSALSVSNALTTIEVEYETF